MAVLHAAAVPRAFGWAFILVSKVVHNAHTIQQYSTAVVYRWCKKYYEVYEYFEVLLIRSAQKRHTRRGPRACWAVVSCGVRGKICFFFVYTALAEPYSSSTRTRSTHRDIHSFVGRSQPDIHSFSWIVRSQPRIRSFVGRSQPTPPNI